MSTLKLDAIECLRYVKKGIENGKIDGALALATDWLEAHDELQAAASMELAAQDQKSKDEKEKSNGG